MRLMPVRYVSDVTAAERSYAALGLAPDQRSRSGHWSELGSTGGLLAMHTAAAAAPARQATDVDLCLVTDEPLETVAERLEQAGFGHDEIADENFGRLLRTRDPDGFVIQVNEHDPSLYT